MTEILEKASSLLKTIIYGVLVVGIVFGLIGVWFVYLGATGKTEFDIFGQSFKSVNVGIGSVFIGGVIVAVTLRRAFKTIELGMNHAATATDKKSKRSDQSLSGTQLELLKIIAESGGIYACHFEGKSELKLNREDIVYRCRDLERDGYITIEKLTDYKYRVTKKGLKAIA